MNIHAAFYDREVLSEVTLGWHIQKNLNLLQNQLSDH